MKQKEIEEQLKEELKEVLNGIEYGGRWIKYE